MRISKIFCIIAIVAGIFVLAAPLLAGNDILIKQDELAGLIGKPGAVVVDAREEKSYNAGHLPGAVNLPFELIVSQRDETVIKKSGVPLPLEKAEKIFSERGINNDSTIVVYDWPPNVAAAYVWMTLKTYGANNVRILAGGIKAWKKEKRPLSKEVTEVTPAVFKASIRTELITKPDWIIKNRENIQLFDTRSLEEYAGARGVGHIPGAVLLEWEKVANAKESFRSAGEINDVINTAGISKDKEVVIYCEVGPKATVVYAAFNMAGFTPKLYWGGMKEWQDDPNRPIAKK